jgi:hypothetical protein
MTWSFSPRKLRTVSQKLSVVPSKSCNLILANYSKSLSKPRRALKLSTLLWQPQFWERKESLCTIRLCQS